MTAPAEPKVIARADGGFALQVEKIKVPGATVGKVLKGVSDGHGGVEFEPGDESGGGDFLPRDGSQAMAGNLDMGGNTIKGLAPPEEDADAARSGDVIARNVLTTQGDLLIADALGHPARLAKGAEGKVLKAGATTVSWDDPPSPSGVALLDSANVFTDLQTFGKGSGSWGTPIPVAAFRHNNGPSSWQGVGVRFEVRNGSDPAITYGYVLARAHGCGGDANDNLVEMRPAFSAGDPPVGLRVRCNVASAIWGVELLLAASGGSPTMQPCREAGSGDVDLTIQGLGTGVVRLPAATGFVGTVTEITALTRHAGVMAFATDASGGAKPCWSTGSAWVLADGSALT